VIQSLAGGAPLHAAHNLDQFAAPAWSPDGSELVYVGFDAGSQRDLFAVKPDGTGQRRITNTPALEAWPSWGP
jgi:Tol biopolymer transport system component